MINLNYCFLFVKLVDAGSFTKAAELLKMPKSRVSRQLAALEEELGVQLIFRTTRHFQLSESGLQFYERSKKAIFEIEGAIEDASQTRHELRGTIRLTAPEDIGVVLLPSIIDTFRKIYPLVSFELILSNKLLNLTYEAIDIAVRIGKLSDSLMRARRVGQVGSYLVASPDLLRRLGDIAKPEDLARGPALSFGDLKNSQQWQLSNGKKHVTLKIIPHVQVNNFFMLRELVLRGQGFAEITRFIIRDDLKHGNLVRLLPQWETNSAPISILTQPNNRSTVIKTFANYLSDHLSQEFG